MRIILYMVLFLMVTVGYCQEDSSFVDPRDNEIEEKLRTVYDAESGRPANQGQYRAGFHRLSGETKLAGGVDTIDINSDLSDGRQDVTFLDSASYNGRAWRMDGNIDTTYTVVALTGSRFAIVSNAVADTSTVRYILEGE